MCNSQSEKASALDRITVWGFKTDAGRFYIERNGNMYDLTLNGETLGSYVHPQQAAEDIAKGGVLTTKTRAGKITLDTSTLGIPADIDEWRAYFGHGKTLYSFGYESRTS
jgi:hypothetical protein